MSTGKYKNKKGYVYNVYIFNKLLNNFPGSVSSSKFTEDEIETILETVTTVKGDKTALDAYKSRINEALSTQEAKAEIDNQHIVSMREDIDRIDSIINSIINVDDRAFFRTDMAKLFLLDYHNQFNLSLTGPMVEYVRYRTYSTIYSVTMRGDSFGIDDLLNVYLHTKYANNSGGTPDLMRRFANTFSIAGYGNDTLKGNGGNDVIYGGVGHDKIDGGTGNDFLFGEADSDTISGGTGNDYLEGGKGDDTLHGGADSDVLLGGTETDYLYGDSGNDTLLGGDDTSTDILLGGSGQDILLAQGGDDVLAGGDSWNDLYSERKAV